MRNPVIFFLNSLVVVKERSVFHFLQEDNAHEENAKDTIAKITEDMVEISDVAERLSAEVIVITKILVACLGLLLRKPDSLQHLVIRLKYYHCVIPEDHLNDWQGVVHADQHHNVDIQERFLVN